MVAACHLARAHPLRRVQREHGDPRSPPRRGGAQPRNVRDAQRHNYRKLCATEPRRFDWPWRGGFYNAHNATLRNVTIAGNLAGNDGAGLSGSPTSTTKVQNTLVVHNLGGNGNCIRPVIPGPTAPSRSTSRSKTLAVTSSTPATPAGWRSRTPTRIRRWRAKPSKSGRGRGHLCAAGPPSTPACSPRRVRTSASSTETSSMSPVPSQEAGAPRLGVTSERSNSSSRRTPHRSSSYSLRTPGTGPPREPPCR